MVNIRVRLNDHPDNPIGVVVARTAQPGAPGGMVKVQWNTDPQTTTWHPYSADVLTVVDEPVGPCRAHPSEATEPAPSKARRPRKG